MGNTPKVHLLKANIANCKQDDLHVGKLYSKLTNLWNKLMNLVNVPVCTCSGCKCGVVNKIVVIYKADEHINFWWA